MRCYAAFLRGVNVGGVNLKMAEVAAALGEAGFTAVHTVLVVRRTENEVAWRCGAAGRTS